MSIVGRHITTYDSRINSWLFEQKPGFRNLYKSRIFLYLQKDCLLNFLFTPFLFCSVNTSFHTKFSNFKINRWFENIILESFFFLLYNISLKFLTKMHYYIVTRSLSASVSLLIIQETMLKRKLFLKKLF